jgi:surface-anchored protein
MHRLLRTTLWLFLGPLPIGALTFTCAVAIACGSREDDPSNHSSGGSGGDSSSEGGTSGHLPAAGAGDVAGGAAGQGEHAGGQGGHVTGTTEGGVGGEAGGAGGAPDGGPLPDDCELLYTQGHGDLFIDYDAHGLSWGIRSSFGNEGPEMVVDPARVCLVVPGASYELAQSAGGAPDAAEWVFLGLDPGDPFWLLPQAAREGMPWFGASTEDVPPNVYVGNKLTFELESIESPTGAHVSAWSSNTFGEPSVIFSTATARAEHDFSVGAHVHFNWAFTRAGLYKIAIVIRGLRDGEEEASAPSFLRVQVLP